MKVKGYARDFGKPFGFPIMPDASQLINDVLNDPEALKNERHDPGVYDENGDYVPQYSDDPSLIEGLVRANNGPASAAGTDGHSESAASSEPAATNELSSSVGE